jgi:ferric-dicitrate binding protein FerR (iron transport regulator)
MARIALASLIVLLGLAAPAAAQEVGTVAGASGAAAIGRGGAFAPAAVGAPVQLGDTLRTGEGQLRVVFQDDSVIDLAENSTLVVDTQVFDPASGRYASLLRLVAGKARALVNQVYGTTPGASYEIETPTAVAGVRGTSFLILYDPARDATDVIGIQGRIQVRSLAERLHDTLYITAAEGTTVERGRAPSAPEPIDANYLRYQYEALQPLALGNVGSLAAANPIKAGESVPPADRAPSSSGLAGQVGRDEMRNPGDVAGQPLNVVDTRGRLGVPF